MEILIVHSGQEALDRLDSLAPDAMFLDVSMPGMNGLDVMAEVKRVRPALAVVIITGHATADEVERVKELGAVDVIQKPSALTTLPSRDRAPSRQEGRPALLEAAARALVAQGTARAPSASCPSFPLT